MFLNVFAIWSKSKIDAKIIFDGKKVDAYLYPLEINQAQILENGLQGSIEIGLLHKNCENHFVQANK